MAVAALSQGKMLTGGDIRDSFKMASDAMGEVQGEVKKLAVESRPQVLTGSEREDFFKGMNQKEFDTMHAIAVAMGPKGLNALERLMQEAEGLSKK